MDGLRWLLLLFGLLLIAGVHFYSGREKAPPKTEPKPADRVEPKLDADDNGDEAPDDAGTTEPDTGDDAIESAPRRPADSVP